MVKVKMQGKVYCCNDCAVVFRIYSKMPDMKTPLCPNCGDNVDVQIYQQKRKGEKKSSIYYSRWTAEEVELIDKVIKGELEAYRAAIMMGRTRASVHGKKRHRIEELRQNG